MGEPGRLRRYVVAHARSSRFPPARSNRAFAPLPRFGRLAGASCCLHSRALSVGKEVLVVLLCAGTSVAIRGYHDAFTGVLGRVIDEPSPLVRTVRLRLGCGSTLDQLYALGQLEDASSSSSCLGCGDPLL